MSPRRWLIPTLGALLGCSPRPAQAGPQSCAPSDAALEAAATGASLAGHYRVRLVATAGPRRDSSADGTLELTPPDSPPADTSHRRFVLLGRGELALTDVGAAQADVASRDPMRPGVLVFDLGHRPAAPPDSRILLRLGAEANRQDVNRLESAYTVLRVREIREDGFTGAWASGAPLPVAEGYFCAWRAPGPAR